MTLNDKVKITGQVIADLREDKLEFGRVVLGGKNTSTEDCIIQWKRMTLNDKVEVKVRLYPT